MTTFGAYFLDEMRQRQLMSDALRAAIGLGSTGPVSRQDAYDRWLFPHPDDQRFAPGMSDGMSSCGLNIRSACAAADVCPELTRAPYSKAIGSVFDTLSRVARNAKAFVSLGTSASIDAAPSPMPGDALFVEGPDHVIGIVDVEGTEDDPVYVTSEGGVPERGKRRDGKGDENGYGIASRKMKLRRVGARLQTGTLNKDGSVKWGRLAVWMLNARWLVTQEGPPVAIATVVRTVTTPGDVSAALALLGYGDVKAFQASWGRGLVVDGAAGRMTRAALQAALASSM